MKQIYSPSRLSYIEKCLGWKSIPAAEQRDAFDHARRGLDEAEKVQTQVIQGIYSHDLLKSHSYALEKFSWASEVMLYSPQEQFIDRCGGRIDLLGIYQDKAWIIEIKTGFSTHHKPSQHKQLLAYTMNVFYNNPGITSITGSILHLDQNYMRSYTWVRDDFPAIKSLLGNLVQMSMYSSDADRSPGTQCVYCHNMFVCSKVSELIKTNTQTRDSLVPDMNDEELGEALTQATVGVKVLEEKRVRLQKIAQTKEKVPGWCKRTVRGQRKWVDGAITSIVQKYPENYIEFMDLKKPGDIDKILKSTKDSVEELITRGDDIVYMVQK